MILRTKRGFTLIEVVLVVLIIAFVAAIATPSFVNSLKGQRLKQATRLVMGCGKYARTMAVSRQRNMNLVLTVGGSRLAVEEGPAPRVKTAPVYTRDQLETLTNEATMDDLALEAKPAPAPAGPSRNLSREMEGVKVKSLVIHDGLSSEEGSVTIAYKSNGTCPPYEIVLVDDDGKESTIAVDFLGDATHEEK